MSHRLKYNIVCKYSGLQIGVLEYETVAGHQPYLSHWDGMVALHPVFSLSTSKLLAFSRNEWNRLAKASEDSETTGTEDNILRVCFLAVLHSLGSLKQEVPALPPLHIVQSNMTRLFALAYWYNYLESQRFKFPSFKINRLNANDGFDNIKDYIDLCFDIKRDYEKGVDDLVEAEKVKAAEKALKALRDSWVVPVSNKQLWRWVRAHLPAKYEADAQGWMGTIFCGSERAILAFDDEEIELMEHIILGECPPGTAILAAVRKRIDTVWQIWRDNKEAFSVDFGEYESEDEDGKPAAPVAEPKLADFVNKVLFIKARALWYLQQRAQQNRKPSSTEGKL